MVKSTEFTPSRRMRWVYRLSMTWLGSLILLHLLALHGMFGDVFMDMANGRWILAHHTVPLSNQLNPTAEGRFWSQPEWLYGVYVAWLWHIGGAWGIWWGLVPWVAAMVYGVVLVTEPAGVLWGTLLTLAVVVSLHSFMSPRPQLLSYAWFIGGLWALQQWRKHRDWPVWVFASMTLIWTQCHPSVFLDPLLLIAEALWGPRRPRRDLLWPILLAGVGCFIRPAGLAGASHHLGALFAPVIRQSIQEWTPWHPWSTLGWIFMPWMAVVPVLIVRAVRRSDAIAVVWAVAGALALILAIRFAPYFVLGVAALGGEALAPLPIERHAGLLGFWILITGLGVSALSLTGMFATTGSFPVREPLAAFAVLRREKAQEVLAAYAWGDALDFYGPPPFADARAGFWSQEPWWNAYVRTQRGLENPAQFAAQWAPHCDAMLWPWGSPAARAMRKNSQWRLIAHIVKNGQSVGIWYRGLDVPS
ncbi:MAG: hypothetical protein C7B46_16970 [Sulfobacillus benefaciens]|uniref:Glycosyltransferase RgtA/B/C/D-like domain-containing protein n=1 Tax=Sulfobacillus benefaciens TaxID=453960 RepID=A0A2T2XA93_9FIRM|nr:MAG: hypothetical protein C7B46_16970 [Sulfobacillus benefaciens]